MIRVNQNQALPPITRIVPDICGRPAVKNDLWNKYGRVVFP